MAASQPPTPPRAEGAESAAVHADGPSQSVDSSPLSGAEDARAGPAAVVPSDRSDGLAELRAELQELRERDEKLQERVEALQAKAQATSGLSELVVQHQEEIRELQMQVTTLKSDNITLKAKQTADAVRGRHALALLIAQIAQLPVLANDVVQYVHRRRSKTASAESPLALALAHLRRHGSRSPRPSSSRIPMHPISHGRPN